MRKASKSKPTPAEPKAAPAAFDVDGIGAVLADALTPREVSAKLRVGKNAVSRWIQSGCPGSGGRLHKLGSIRVGCKYFVPRAALAEFLAATNA